MEVDGTTVIDIDKFAGRYYVDGRGYACRDQRSYLNPIHEEVSRPGVGRLILF